MKIAVQIARILVAVLFIVSGLIKADDPLGLSYKMEEFFEVWNSSLAAHPFFLNSALISFFTFLHHYSLFLAIVMITFEIMAGLALLIGWKPKSVVNLLLLLILFFTFLTGYAYTSGKFKDCGCFGNCLPITPLTSFLKDLALLLLILLLVGGKRYLASINTAANKSILVIGLLLTLGLQWYVLTYMPLVDCLPFKKGNNITQKMKIPANAVPDSFAIRFIYEKNGKEYHFSPSELPADLGTYHFVSRQDELIRKGNAEPDIKGFSLTTLQDEDLTTNILSDTGYTVLYFTTYKKGSKEWKPNASVDNFLHTAKANGINIYAVTTTGQKLLQQFQQLHWSIPVLTCDGTAFRTAARTDPNFYFLKQGTIINKWSLPQLPAATKQLPSPAKLTSAISIPISTIKQ